MACPSYWEITDLVIGLDVEPKNISVRTLAFAVQRLVLAAGLCGLTTPDAPVYQRLSY